MSGVSPAAVQFAAKVAESITRSSAPFAAAMNTPATPLLRRASSSSLSSAASKADEDDASPSTSKVTTPAEQPLPPSVGRGTAGRTRRSAATSAMKKMKTENSHDEDPKMLVDKDEAYEESQEARVANDVADAADENAMADGDDEELTKSGTKRKRKRKQKSPEVYVIPDVERLETTFRGRLGYACLNTILRKQKPPVFCSRTCRIDTILKPENGMDYVKELGRQNMIDLKALIEWNAKHNIYFMRMSSEMFPFASHPEYGYSLEYCQKELKEAGDLAKSLGMRLTTHPGQYTQLGSPRPHVIENAFRDLNYHAQMIDLMGLDQDSVMILHGGGVYGDKAQTIERIKQNYAKLSQTVKNRLVFENDEICYNVDDLLPICEEVNVPLVFDYHHDWINPSSKPIEELWPRIEAIWKRKGIKPKQHLSEPRPGAETVMEKRAHADRCQRLPAALPDDMDLMIEAKDKEQACFHLFRIYGLQPVIHESLRPPAEVESLRTNGRKSHKKKKVKAEDDDGEEGLGTAAAGEEEGMEDPEADAAAETPTKAKKPPAAAKRGKKRQKKEEEDVVKDELDDAIEATIAGGPVAAAGQSEAAPVAEPSASTEATPQKRKRRTKKEMEEARANGTAPPLKRRLTKKQAEDADASASATVASTSTTTEAIVQESHVKAEVEETNV